MPVSELFMFLRMAETPLVQPRHPSALAIGAIQSLASFSLNKVPPTRSGNPDFGFHRLSLEF
jgi:hypothetical protein